MYTKEAAILIFPNIYSYRQSFETEILCIAGITACSIISVENDLVDDYNLKMESKHRIIELFYLAVYYFIYITGIHKNKSYYIEE